MINIALIDMERKYHLFLIFFTKVTDTDKMNEMLNQFNNEVNELKSDYLSWKDEDDDVIENASLVYNNQFNFVDDYTLKDK